MFGLPWTSHGRLPSRKGWGQAEFLDERKPLPGRGDIDGSFRLSHLAAPIPLYLAGSDGHWWQTRTAHDQDGPVVIVVCRCRGHLRKPSRADERIRVQVDHPDRILAHVNGPAPTAPQRTHHTT